MWVLVDESDDDDNEDDDDEDDDDEFEVGETRWRMAHIIRP